MVDNKKNMHLLIIDEFLSWQGCNQYILVKEYSRQEGSEKIDTLIFPPTLEYSTGLS